MSKDEQTGKRESDKWWSNTHRKFNSDFLMTDIDGLEYEHTRTGISFKCVFDVKTVKQRKIGPGSLLRALYDGGRLYSSIEAYKELANSLSIPGCVLFTNKGYTQFVAVSLNGTCDQKLSSLIAQDGRFGSFRVSYHIAAEFFETDGNILPVLNKLVHTLRS